MATKPTNIDDELDEYMERAEEIMPSWFFWGEGIILVNRGQWYRSRLKIQALLKHLHRANRKLREAEDAKN